MGNKLTETVDPWVAVNFTSDHTPGPWRVEDEQFVSAKDGPIFGGAATQRSDDENHANARLMAAAPEMYTALAIAETFLGLADDSCAEWNTAPNEEGCGECAGCGVRYAHYRVNLALKEASSPKDSEDS